MEFTYILQNIAAVITLLFGIFGLFKPNRFARGLYFELDGARGRAEMRIGLGGPTIAIAVYTLISQHSAAFTTLGLFWLGGAVTRVLAVAVDRPVVNRSYIRYFLIEIVTALGLLWAPFMSNV